MRLITFIMAALLLSLAELDAQDNFNDNTQEQEINTIFGNGEVSHSGYGAISTKYTKFNDENSVLMGARGAWTINKSFSIGIAGYGLATPPEFSYVNGDNESVTEDLLFGYGGLFIEYIHNPTDIVNLSANTLIGFGGAALVEDYFYAGHGYEYDYDQEPHAWGAYFVAEPSVTVQFNVTTFFRISLDAGYRFVSELRTSKEYDSISKLKDINMDGFSGGITFQFGCF